MSSKHSKHRNFPVVVKVGSESADFDTPAGRDKLHHLASEISYLMTSVGQRVVLITSGAVSHGRKVLDVPKDQALSVEAKRALASVGQPRLIANWDAIFRACDPSVRIPAIGQGLVTHAQIEDSIEHSNGLLSGLEGLWSLGALPILNENDFAIPEEIEAMERGADNDRNALLVARLVNAGHLAIMTNANGVYRHSDDPSSRIPVLHAARIEDGEIARMCQGKSKSGTGGMASKLGVARDAAHLGIAAHIFNGTDSGLLDHVTDSPDRKGGTVVLP